MDRPTPESSLSVRPVRGNSGGGGNIPPPAQLRRGDCLSLLRRIPAGSIDAIITDPPYGTTDAAWDQAPPLDEWWAQIHRVAKVNAVIAVFCQQPFTTDLIAANRKHFRYELIWHKTRPAGFLNVNRRPLRDHESIQVFTRFTKGATYHPQMIPAAPRWLGGNHNKRSTLYRSHDRPTPRRLSCEAHPRTVLRFAKDPRGELIHPTQKPVALCEWLVRSFTEPGQVVLDPYAGSCSTGVACIRAGRAFIGIERDATFFVAGGKRLRNASSLLS